jgi:hypothetical protein
MAKAEAEMILQKDELMLLKTKMQAAVKDLSHGLEESYPTQFASSADVMSTSVPLAEEAGCHTLAQNLDCLISQMKSCVHEHHEQAQTCRSEVAIVKTESDQAEKCFKIETQKYEEQLQQLKVAQSTAHMTACTAEAKSLFAMASDKAIARVQSEYTEEVHEKCAKACRLAASNEIRAIAAQHRGEEASQAYAREAFRCEMAVCDAEAQEEAYRREEFDLLIDCEAAIAEYAFCQSETNTAAMQQASASKTAAERAAEELASANEAVKREIAEREMTTELAAAKEARLLEMVARQVSAHEKALADAAACEKIVCDSLCSNLKASQAATEHAANCEAAAQAALERKNQDLVVAKLEAASREAATSEAMSQLETQMQNTISSETHAYESAWQELQASQDRAACLEENEMLLAKSDAAHRAALSDAEALVERAAQDAAAASAELSMEIAQAQHQLSSVTSRLAIASEEAAEARQSAFDAAEEITLLRSLTAKWMIPDDDCGAEASVDNKKVSVGKSPIPFAASYLANGSGCAEAASQQVSSSLVAAPPAAELQLDDAAVSEEHTSHLYPEAVTIPPSQEFVNRQDIPTDLHAEHEQVNRMSSDRRALSDQSPVLLAISPGSADGNEAPPETQHLFPQVPTLQIMASEAQQEAAPGEAPFTANLNEADVRGAETDQSSNVASAMTNASRGEAPEGARSHSAAPGEAPFGQFDHDAPQDPTVEFDGDGYASPLGEASTGEAPRDERAEIQPMVMSMGTEIEVARELEELENVLVGASTGEAPHTGDGMQLEADEAQLEQDDVNVMNVHSTGWAPQMEDAAHSTGESPTPAPQSMRPSAQSHRASSGEAPWAINGHSTGAAPQAENFSGEENQTDGVEATHDSHVDGSSPFATSVITRATPCLGAERPGGNSVEMGKLSLSVGCKCQLYLSYKLSRVLMNQTRADNSEGPTTQLGILGKESATRQEKPKEQEVVIATDNAASSSMTGSSSAQSNKKMLVDDAPAVSSKMLVDLQLAQEVDAAAWELVNMARDIDTSATHVLAAVRHKPSASDAADPKFEEIKRKMGCILEKLVTKALESAEFRRAIMASRKEVASKSMFIQGDVPEVLPLAQEDTFAALKHFNPAEPEREMQASEVDMASDGSCEVLARDKLLDLLTNAVRPGGPALEYSQDSVDAVLTDFDDAAPAFVQVSLQGNANAAGSTESPALPLEDFHASRGSWSLNHSQALTVASNTSAQEVAELRMQGGLLRERCRALERQVKRERPEKRL